MAIRLGGVIRQQLGELRTESTAKRIRAVVGGQTLADTTSALLVWEPKRVVPTYAVPTADLAATPHESDAAVDDLERWERWPLWDPSVPFGVRRTPGRAVHLDVGGRTVDGFVADDPDLADYVILDFDGVDTWLEGDDAIISHPHDPFSRIDIRATSAHLRFALDGVTIAETRRAHLLFETNLPTRYYVPRDDVVVELAPSDTVTTCAYKGVARYFSPVIDGGAHADLAWAYEDPLIDAEPVRGAICFFDEKLDLTIDGVERPRPTTPWS